MLNRKTRELIRVWEMDRQYEGTRDAIAFKITDWEECSFVRQVR